MKLMVYNNRIIVTHLYNQGRNYFDNTAKITKLIDLNKPREKG